MRYFITFSYDGTPYHGWQIQPNALTVQEILEDCISKLLGQKITVIGAGRTDTGVHAQYMVAHLDSEKELTDDFIHRLNAFLPNQIAIYAIQKVKDNAHARFDATSRTYQYHIFEGKNPFFIHLAWQRYSGKLDVEKMNLAAEKLFHYIDFTSFARLHSDNKTNFCTITFSQWKKQNSELIFTITADRFLRNMVRAIVGTLVDVGLEKISVDNFCEIIEKKDRKFASASAPAHGLFLTQISYPNDLFL